MTGAVGEEPPVLAARDPGKSDSAYVHCKLGDTALGSTPDDGEVGEEHPSSSPVNLWPIIVIAFLHFLSFAMSIPVYPLICQSTSYARTKEFPHGDPALGQELFSYAVAANAFFEFVTASFLGVLSDGVCVVRVMR